MVQTPNNPDPGSVDDATKKIGEELAAHFRALRDPKGEGLWDAATINENIRSQISASLMMVTRYNDGKVTVPGENGQPGITYKISENGNFQRVKPDGTLEPAEENNNVFSPVNQVSHALCLAGLQLKAKALTQQLLEADTNGPQKRLDDIRAAQNRVLAQFGLSAEQTQQVATIAKRAANYDDAAKQLRPIVGTSQRSDDLITYLMYLEKMKRSVGAGHFNNPDLTDKLRDNNGIQQFAALTDIVGFQATGQRPPSAIDTVDGKPAAQNLPMPDIRLFDPRVYELIEKETMIDENAKRHYPNIPGEWLGPQYAGREVPYKEFCQIAQERFDQRLREQGIPPHKATEALFDKDSGLSAAPKDLQFVLHGMGNGQDFNGMNQAFNAKYGSLADVPKVTTYVTNGHYTDPNYNASEVQMDGQQIVKRFCERFPAMTDTPAKREEFLRNTSAASYFDAVDHGRDGSHHLERDLMAKNYFTYERTRRMAAGIVDGDPARYAKQAENTPGAPAASPAQKAAEIRACGSEITCQKVTFSKGADGNPEITFDSGQKMTLTSFPISLPAAITR